MVSPAKTSYQKVVSIVLDKNITFILKKKEKEKGKERKETFI